MRDGNHVFWQHKTDQSDGRMARGVALWGTLDCPWQVSLMSTCGSRSAILLMPMTSPTVDYIRSGAAATCAWEPQFGSWSVSLLVVSVILPRLSSIRQHAL